MDKIIASKQVSISSISGKSVVLSSEQLKDGFYTEWYLKVGDNITEIESNTKAGITLKYDIPAEYSANTAGTLLFIIREYIQKYDDTVKNISMVSDALLLRKICLAEEKVNKEAFAHLRGLYGESFNPIDNVKNSYVLKTAAAYCVLESLFFDLSVSQDSYNETKSARFERAYKDEIKRSLQLILVDKDQDGALSADEKAETASPLFLGR